MSATGLLVPVVLLALELCSCLYLWSLPHEGKAKTDGRFEDVELESSAAFYKRQRLRKALFVCSVIVLCALELGKAPWDGARKETTLLRQDLLMAAFWGVLIVLGIKSFSLPREEIDLHWSYTVSFATLTFLVLSTTIFRLVLPTDHAYSPPADSSKATAIAIQVLSAVNVTFQAIAFLLSGTTPRCAQLWYTPPSLTEPSVKEAREITPAASCSPIDYLLFVWITPVVRTGYAAVESLDEKTLPMLAYNDRARNGFTKAKETKVPPAPRWCNGLLWRVLYINKRLVFWQSILAVVTAVLYYLPAFFLQRLVKVLENRPAPITTLVFPLRSSLPETMVAQTAADKQTSIAWGYFFCLALLATALIDAIAQAQLWFVSNTMLSARIRVQLNTLLFDKTLRRKDVTGASKASKAGQEDNKSSTDGGGDGEDLKKAEEETFGSKNSVMNLFSIDVDRVADFAIWSFTFIDAPMELAIGTYFLYKLLGYAAFIGISISILFLPLNHYTSKAFASVQDRLMAARDKRVSLMSEVMNSVRMIKYMAIEKPFEERILRARSDELAHLRRNYMLEVGFNFIWSASPVLCVLVSFYVYTSVMHRELTPSTAFASLAVWNELRFALNVIPDVIVNGVQCLISLRRIEKYLQSPEVEIPLSAEEKKQSQPNGHHANGTSSSGPAFISATVTWPRAEVPTVDDDSDGPVGVRTPGGSLSSFQLQDLDIRFPLQQLTLVCGSLGAGKTLLLLSLLGEADTLAGQVVCPRSAPDAIELPSLEWYNSFDEENWIAPDTTAFVPQGAWLQNASIRDNICFGLPFREERYQATLHACSLLSDLAILEDGDQTEIGEKGINLSGGQKARVSLARAVYSRASTVLLDDVLSAVDAHTALHIYNECIKGPLMKNRTVILVSHHVQLTAPGADHVVELTNGRATFQGSGSEYLASDRFKTAVADEEEQQQQEQVEIKAENAKSQTKPKNKVLASVAESAAVSLDNSSASEAESSDDEESEDGDEIDEKDRKTPRKLIEDEQRAVGRVSGAVWKLYLGLSGGLIFWFFFVLSFGGSKLVDVAGTYWLNIWSSSYDSSKTGDKRPVSFYLAVYAALSLLACFVSTLQWFVLYTGALRASAGLYRRLLRSVLRAPLRFFDTTAAGRILNRFSKDMEQVDASLPDHYGRSTMYALGVTTTLVVVASVSPVFLVGFAFLAVAYFHHARLFSKTARELRRLDSVSKSPLFSIYGEAVAGVSVIRAFGSSKRFMALMLQRCATNVTYYWLLWSVTRWLSIRFSLLSAVVVALTGFLLLRAGDSVDAGLAGFALTFSLQISNDILFLVRRYTALELAMVGVERIKEYSEIEQEAPEVIEPRPPAHWPHAGEIHVEELTIRYAPELPDVLHEVSFNVKPGEKIGVVGATGSGKSTLALSFFRFVEAWSGRIVVDGIDIAKVGLKDLRSHLTIIPQDPTILSGTLRTTLDIFGEFSDQEIFDALRRVHLIKPGEMPSNTQDGENESPFFNLDGEVAEGGANFSQGQRQLLCMARALLRRNKVMLLDEATASVDYETDEMISNTIRSEFSDSTLLVIAHRLRTIIDFNKVLLLDAGRVVEFDSPLNLINDETSRFHALCRATGRTEFKLLKKMASGKTKATHKPRKVVRRPSMKGVGSSGRKSSGSVKPTTT